MGWIKDVLAPLTKQKTTFEMHQIVVNRILLWADANVMTSPSSEGSLIVLLIKGMLKLVQRMINDLSPKGKVRVVLRVMDTKLHQRTQNCKGSIQIG